MELREIIDTLGDALGIKFILKWSITRHPIVKANMVHKAELYILDNEPTLVLEYRKHYLKDKMVEESKKADLEFLNLVFRKYGTK